MLKEFPFKGIRLNIFCFNSQRNKSITLKKNGIKQTERIVLALETNIKVSLLAEKSF